MTPFFRAELSGSLRRGSYNAAALRAACDLQTEGIRIESADLSGIPIYNEDTEAAGHPPAVAALRRQVAAADALLISTPEYNYSLPGVLKNTIDWLSRVDPGRPPSDASLNDKPLGIMGFSRVNSARRGRKLHRRQVCVYTNMLPLNRPEVLIGHAAEKFDAQGQLTDDTTRKFIAELLQLLSSWTRRLKGTAPIS